MDDEMYYEFLRSEFLNKTTQASYTCKYMLPLNFNRGEILFFMDGQNLNLEIFYNKQNNNNNLKNFRG